MVGVPGRLILPDIFARSLANFSFWFSGVSRPWPTPASPRPAYVCPIFVLPD